jgi:hypothetical protein
MSACPENLLDPKDPSYYKQFFGYDEENTPYEADYQDCIYGEYIQIYGHAFDVYLCSTYDPIPVFGEDPVKRYTYEPFLANGMWDVTPETLVMGQFGKNTDQESVIIWFHKTTVKESIKATLIAEGVIDASETVEDESGFTKYDRHRRELQEGDIIRMRFNNIHYEIDGVKEEPEFQHHLYKYVYEVHARPRLVSAEELGEMQPVTEADEIRIEHETEIQIEADKILF